MNRFFGRASKTKEPPQESFIADAGSGQVKALRVTRKPSSPVKQQQQQQQQASTKMTPSPQRTATAAPELSPSEMMSSDYLLISECHTGKPVTERSPLGERNCVPLVVPLKPSRSLCLDDSYDIPRSSQTKHQVSMMTHVKSDFLDKVPPPPTNSSDMSHKLNNGTIPGRSLKLNPPPQVNWSTYPKDTFAADASRASVRSCNASFESNNESMKQSRSRFESGPAQSGRRRSSTPNGNEMYLNTSAAEMSIGEGQNNSSLTQFPLQPPPRPPKPPSLRKSTSISGSCSSLPNEFTECYDTPPSSSDRADPKKKFKNKKPDSAKTPEKSSPAQKKSPRLQQPSHDVLYDFPRPMSEVTGKGDLEAIAQLSSQTMPRSGLKHAYGNAPAGFCATKESVFTYDYRPSLPTSSDDNFAQEPVGYDLNPDQSPRTPNSANLIYSNSKLPPPAVNRDLKPRRKNSESDTTASPTTPNTFQLAPPPAVVRRQNGQVSPSKGFKKTVMVRSAPLLNSAPPPRIPCRSTMMVSHSREASYEDNNPGNLYNSFHEVYDKVMPPRKIVNLPEAKEEIQYLDLDLESDTNSSPRTPNMDTVSLKSTTVSISGPKDTHSLHSSRVTLPPGEDYSSTVYKSVDFLRTQAFNQLRLSNMNNKRKDDRNPH